MSEDVAKRDLEFRDSDALEEWLQRQPREVSVIIAARAALRVLPVAASEFSTLGARQFGELISTVFRATALAWVAAKYPARAEALSSRSAAVAASTVAYAATRDNSPARASFAAVNAAQAADATNTAFAHSAAFVTYIANTTAAAWEALSRDVGFLSQGGAVAALADRPLWPDGTPTESSLLWAKLAVKLPVDHNWGIASNSDSNHAGDFVVLPPGEHWEVWTRWYDERLAGAPAHGDAYELVFATIPKEVWKEGPAAANRWIKEHLPKSPPTIKPLENIPCVFTFGWSAANKITVVAGPQNQPVFPSAINEADHKQWLENCRAQIERLLADLRSGRLNPRSDYCEALERYNADLPTAPGQGNFMLADQEARILRDMFEAEADCLAASFAARLRAFLQQHIALRGFYPEVERFYDAVQKSRIEKPLPWDNVEGFARTILDNTPDKFEPVVSKGLKDVEREEPVIELVDVPHDPKAIQPPSDPLGPLKPEDSRSYGVASFVNGIMKIVAKGKEAGQIYDGWEHLEHKLWEDAAWIIDWLHNLPPS